ncbi:LysE family translocator [Cryobacterium sp. Y62]|uniref:LysE family translocator n=1 Tax=Cryobacterium sp. Y62 TaxID=2048284 RepID=UPI000CE3AE0A|nr:LysE family translocator [Cryobacterium sp. Y62]
MTISQAVLGFATVAAILTVIPGLDTTLVLRSALVRGRRQAVVTAFGIATGALIWGAAAALGAAALLAASHLAYQMVTIGGPLYMGYLGVSMIVKSFHSTGNGHATTATTESASLWRSFSTGTWTNLLNPKIGVFYIATIPQFIPEGTSPLAMGLLLSAVHALMSLVWFAVIIVGANSARRWLAHARALRIIDRCAGTVLIGFGVKLALEHR